MILGPVPSLPFILVVLNLLRFFHLLSGGPPVEEEKEVLSLSLPVIAIEALFKKFGVVED